jgi:hypothetical protein
MAVIYPEEILRFKLMVPIEFTFSILVQQIIQENTFCLLVHDNYSQQLNDFTILSCISCHMEVSR